MVNRYGDATMIEAAERADQQDPQRMSAILTTLLFVSLPEASQAK
jgi:hypothetical protein